jgi:predicted transcriptional regulator
MDPLKEAFQKVKEEINNLSKQINLLSVRVSSIEKGSASNLQHIGNHSTLDIQTPTGSSTQNPAVPQEIRGFKSQFLEVSTGNEGVPTDKPTDRQTNQQTDNLSKISSYNLESPPLSAFEKAQEVLNSLDTIKKEIRLKFKRLTNKEMLLFSTIYSLEERGITPVTYKLLANNLNLTESSIRDYTNKLLSKGIPLLKTKSNNKQVSLTISSTLQQVASLQTILKLRDL